MSESKQNKGAGPSKVEKKKPDKMICGAGCKKSDCNGTCGATAKHTGPHTCWLCGKSWE